MKKVMKSMKKERIGVVASGGAVRGVFHIGVLQTLASLKVPIQVYVGASSGAFISSFAAAGVSPNTLAKVFSSRRDKRIPRLTRFHLFHLNSDLFTKGFLRAGGLFEMNRLERYIEENIPINDFRKLKKKLFVTAVNLHTGNRVVFGKGYIEDVPISKAVAASMSLVPIFRPYCLDGVPLIDGEFKKTFSIDLALKANVHTVFASNVYVPYRPRKTKGKLHTTSLINILQQALFILIEEKIYQGIEFYHDLYPNTDIYFIESDNRDFFVAPFDLYRAEELIQSGRKKTIQVLREAGFRRSKMRHLKIMHSGVA